MELLGPFIAPLMGRFHSLLGRSTLQMGRLMGQTNTVNARAD